MDVVRSAGLFESREVQGQQKTVIEHTLDNIVRRAYYIVVLVSFLDFGKHSLVDIECHIDDFDFLSGLLLVPLLEVFDYAFGNVG